MAEPITSQQLDAGLRALIQRHAPGAGDDSVYCVKCGEYWPCRVVVMASISLKLTVIAQFLGGDLQAARVLSNSPLGEN